MCISGLISASGLLSFLSPAHDAPSKGTWIMENIGIAFLAIAETAHEWADDIASESGRDYDAVRARLGERNKYFRLAL
jgi:hypothetical protein